MIHYKTWHICGWPIRKNNRICQLDNPIWFTFVNEKRNVHRPLEKIKKKGSFLQDFFFLAQTPLFFQSLRIEKWKAGKENIFHLLCCYTSKVAISLWKAATFECKKGGLFPPQKKEGRRKCTRKKVETFIIFLMAKHRFSRRFMKGPFRELSTITNEFFFLRTVLG